MQRERRRAALAALCVVAVTLAATLFPAGGFGTQPAGVGTGGGPDAPPGGTAADPTRSSDGPPAETASTAATTDDTPTETTTTATTTTTTATETETTTAAASSDSGDEPGPGAVFGALAAFAVALLAVGLRAGTVGVTTDTPGGLPFTVTVRGTPVGSLVGKLPSRTMELVVGLSASVPRLVDDAAALGREAGDGLATALGAAAAGAGSALRVGASGLGATVAAIPRALAGLGAGTSVFSGVGLPSLGGRGRSRGRGAGGSSGPADADPEDPAPPSVEEAWQAMSERVRVRNRDARTPGEVARAAVERGYPDEAVERLTDAFREVRYGGLPREERTSVARAALDALRRHWEDDDE